jgi:4-alpha-glucanotransferase
MSFPRRSGVVLHPTSLPSRFGIGDLGEQAYRFVDFLVAGKQTYWQVLPLGPTGYGDSPYQTLSAFAGNPLLISLEHLVNLGHLAENDLQNVPNFPSDRVDFGAVIPFKINLLDHAFENFRANATDLQRKSFAKFCKQHKSWLDEFALFMALKEANGLKPWYEWEHDLKHHETKAIAAARKSLADAIEKQKYRQWIFVGQWLALKKYANEHGVQIIGDIPIFVSEDSVDVWANTHLFNLDKNLRPLAVSGVPPDFFSATGQLWGHPLYRWDVMQKEKFTWWIERFRAALLYADVIRIDHFRGFYNYWAVPAGAQTAAKGKWLLTPGGELFSAVNKALGDVPIIAEDLGSFDPKSLAGVRALQAEFGYPGMKVLQFAFNSDANEPFLPHNFTRDFVVYAATHDANTCVGWYANASEKERDYARRYLARDGSDIAWDLIRLAWSSIADTAMTLAQDLLGLGNSARMNFPSTLGPQNWTWRVLPGALNEGIAARLAELTTIYGRAN